MTQGSTRHLVDPELQPLLDAFPTVRLDIPTLAALREAQAAAIAPIGPDSVTVLEREVPASGDSPAIALRVYLPDDHVARPLGCIYHIHGGGFVAGSTRQVEFWVRPFARELGCAVVSIEYRRAPEHPYPAALDDCHAGLVWTFDHAAELGIDPQRIGVMGESAGGGLAAALALLVRDRGEHRLAFQLLTYPMLDDRTCVRNTLPQLGEFIWTRHNNLFGWSALLGEEPGGENVSAYAAPARAESLAGLPPTYIDTAGLDLFFEEDLAYAARLAEHGVPLEFHVWPGAFHGFDLAGEARVSRAARAAKFAALQRFLGA